MPPATQLPRIEPRAPELAVAAATQPRLHLLGSFRLKFGDESCGLPQGPQRVLAALTLRGRMSRNRLAGLLWPETPQIQAQTNVRQALWRLVQATAGAHLVSAVGCDLELNAEVTSDVGVLLSEAHGLRGVSRVLPPQCWLDDLLRAEAVELLPDWDDEWLDVDRERLRQLRLHVLDDWALRLTEAGDYGLALEVALSALHSDILRESAHRAVIRVHRAEGNVHEARRAFAACCSVLTEEIGVGPSPLTQALVP